MFEDSTKLKFFIWGRKIAEQVEYFKEENYSDERIREFLQNCADLREHYLDPDNLTETEEIWTERVQKYFKEYSVIDPIFENS